MDITFRNRNGRISERQQAHIEEKLSRLSRYLDVLSAAVVEVSHETRPNTPEAYRVQVTLYADRGVIVRADQHGADLYTAVDEVSDILQRQLVRYKEKHWRRGKLRHRSGELFAAELPEDGMRAIASEAEPAVAVLEEDSAPAREIVRVKEFILRPMFSDEAIEQMELLGHSFFVFRDAETERLSVVYRRWDGNYGLIMPR
ncbi:MAG: ribosome-associated translation inhibitor RaiA [Chloroflexaceae bacterium]|nr:ribosome-associated translation inhibitor RaiA [Chloroflexaceae bacterium]